MTRKKYDFILQGGTVIDPVNGASGVRDIAVKDGKIAWIEDNPAYDDAAKVFPVHGKYVTPGLIDMHNHVNTREGVVIDADDIGIYSGVTTICDAGGAGAAHFYDKRRFVFDHTIPDMFCFINFAMIGLSYYHGIRGEYDINPDLTKKVIEQNSDIIKGIKFVCNAVSADGMGIKAVELAKKLADDVHLPLVIHVGEKGAHQPHDPMDEFCRAATRLLDKGDVLTHFMSAQRGGLVLPDGTVYPELFAAQKRGVELDSSHGSTHFCFDVARICLDKGLLPTLITTDLAFSSPAVVQSLLVTMSKFINLGLSVEQVVEMTTRNPARVLKEEANRGSLRPGMPADISVLELVEGNFFFTDNTRVIKGHQLLEPRKVFKDGREYPCYSKYHLPVNSSDLKVTV